MTDDSLKAGVLPFDVSNADVIKESRRVSKVCIFLLGCISGPTAAVAARIKVVLARFVDNGNVSKNCLEILTDLRGSTAR